MRAKFGFRIFFQSAVKWQILTDFEKKYCVHFVQNLKHFELFFKECNISKCIVTDVCLILHKNTQFSKPQPARASLKGVFELSDFFPLFQN